MLPHLGCYEERYRLTGRVALGLVGSLLSIGLGILWHSALIFTALAVVLAVPVVISLAHRRIAFRADHAGITLGGVPDELKVRRTSAVFVPWADVEKIILYPAYPRGQGGSARVQCIGVQRREGAPDLYPEATRRPPAARCLG